MPAAQSLARQDRGVRLGIGVLALLVVFVATSCGSKGGNSTATTTGTGGGVTPVTVSSLSPAAAVGGTSVVVTGSGFGSGTTARIDSTPCTSVTITSATQLTCVVPSLGSVPDAKDLVVTNASGGSATLADGLAFLGTPAVWLRADSLSLADGASVSSWPDQSGNVNNATQGTANMQPTYVASAASLNNRPSVRFFQSGPADLLTLGSVVAVRTAFFRYENIGAGNQDSYIFGRSGATTNFELDPDNGNTVITIAGAAVTGASSFEGNGTYAVVLDGANAFVRHNKSSIAATGATTLALPVNEIGDWSGAGGGLIGNLPEVILYTTALSAAQQDVIESYLNAKYNN